MGRVALITGILGQDGSHLADLLLEKGYAVYGMMRRISVERFTNVAHIMQHPNFRLVTGDLTDQNSLNRLVKEIQPDEVYNLAAQSHVGISFEQPVFTSDVTGLGVLRVLEAVRLMKPDARFYQASSSEMFGKVQEVPQTEVTPFYPRSPYACAKVYGFDITRNYRDNYDMFCCNGILFNHEGPRRGKNFVTRKITCGAAEIKLLQPEGKLGLGLLTPKRDWGYAGDYCINLDVPILTTQGWRFYDDINEGDEVINFDPTHDRLTIDRVKRKVLLNSEGDKIVIQGRGLYLCVTPQHRIYYQRKYKCQRGWDREWQVCTAEEFFDLLHDKSKRTKYDYRLPHFRGYEGTEYPISDAELYLIGALLAEGCVPHIPSGKGMVVSLSQSYVNDRVVRKIRECIDALGLQYRISNRRDGVTEWVFNAESSRRILDLYDGYDVHVFPTYLWRSSRRQLEILFTALMDCDGHWGGMRYISKRYRLAVDFQTIAHIIGYRTTGVKQYNACYSVCCISKRKPYAHVQSVERINDAHSEVWCVETNNGTIVTRDFECISVSGNCKAMWLMMQHDKPDDYVIATGETHTVEEFCRLAFECVGLDYKNHVFQDPRFVRPAEVNLLIGDASKAKEVLGWEPEVKFEQLIETMVKADLDDIRWRHRPGRTKERESE